MKKKIVLSLPSSMHVVLFVTCRIGDVHSESEDSPTGAATLLLRRELETEHSKIPVTTEKSNAPLQT